ncbi:hypothetical protein K5D32_02610 [Pseudomonas cichorii]|uniref:hypothetical protein n=1 Tax=Pseudomonas cichorii TaxID=36746 RepID=UPI001C89260D|nr:hypothetical protein [Pseudomonas cichorii]MBX8528535.1 hypothetical protein [Pseudomonas cichorii]
MSHSQFNQMMSVLWLIAAGVQHEVVFEAACLVFFVVCGLKSLYWGFAERKGARP